MTIKEAAAWISTVGGAVAMLFGLIVYGWGLHNSFLMSVLDPIEGTLNGINRGILAQRLRNYRELQCDSPDQWNQTLQDAMDEASLQYIEIVGREISVMTRPCDEL